MLGDIHRWINLLNDPRRGSHRDRKARYISRHDTVSANHDTLPQRDAWDDDRSCADPAVVSNGHFFREGGADYAAPVVGVSGVRCCADADVGTDHYAVAEGYEAAVEDRETAITYLLVIDRGSSFWIRNC